jgi:hypothetical protein
MHASKALIAGAVGGAGVSALAGGLMLALSVVLGRRFLREFTRPGVTVDPQNRPGVAGNFLSPSRSLLASGAAK